MPIDDLIAKMKAKGVPGSTEAEEILDQLLSGETQEPAEAELSQIPSKTATSERTTT
ncbi:MAG: hypothetical protein QUS33_06240 [Dehalococcoidia bacterium]|nr:hypothetical protein [Dehalococcoidia bacterium]